MTPARISTLLADCTMDASAEVVDVPSCLPTWLALRVIVRMDAEIAFFSAGEELLSNMSRNRIIPRCTAKISCESVGFEALVMVPAITFRNSSRDILTCGINCELCEASWKKKVLLPKLL